MSVSRGPDSLPPNERAFWHRRSQEEYDLLYLGWGRRLFGETPHVPVVHPGWMTVVIESGSPTLVFENVEQPMSPGEAVVVGPDRPVGWKDKKEGVCRIMMWIWRAPAIDLFEVEDRNMLRLFTIPEVLMDRVRQIHAWCREEVSLADHASPAALSGLQKTLEAALWRSKHPKLGLIDRDRHRIDLAVRWLESHLDCRQPCARLADYLDISVASVLRLFQRRYAKSLQEFYHAMRMDWARNQLVAGGHSVKEIAFDLGYRHAGDFSRAFGLYFGCAPSEVAQID